jgi:hypothetical protein
MKKVFSFILLALVGLFLGNADAFLVGTCPIDGKKIDGNFGGISYETTTIKCDDSGQCEAVLLTTSDGLNYSVSDLNFSCSSSSFLIDNVRCFYDANNYRLTCVLVDDNSLVSFSANNRTFSYSKDVPLVRFMVR